jgi:tRNA threonylcarbamoyladenosine biosynthesis protein TsaE
MDASAAEHRSRELVLPDLEATRALARRIASLARVGDVIGLSGDLGAGKTTFARFFIAALGGHEDVPSPTFTLVQTYDLAAATVWHFDLYRVERAIELRELGLEDALAEGISLIEWPERLGPLMPADNLELRLSLGERPEARRARLEAHGSWCARLDAAAGNG